MASATGKEMKLLFFDTLHHGNSKEELNLDLIQFSKPVVVHELRVVPLKTYVELNIGKGLRLGGTLPAEFKLDVFVNNLEKPKSSTFEKLGQLDYKENINILLKPEREVATDGLILKGWYRTVTLAVYGWETVVKPPQDSPPPPPPPLPGHQPPQSKAKIPGLDISDEETTKPVVQQQHKLDFLNEQVQKRQQLTAASSGRDLHKPSSIEDSFDVLRKLSPRRDISRDTDRSTIRDQDRGLSRDLDRGSSRDKDRDYTFPPEPNEPYELREKTERDRSRSRERDRDSRHTSRDDERPHSREDREREHRRERIGRHGSRELEERDSKDHSRERSREPRDSKDNRDSSERERVREERHRDRSERDSGRDLEDKEREIKLIETRERESEQKEKEMKEKEREKDLQREKEQREKDLKEREQKEKEKEKEAEKEKDRERQAKERELECEREKERFAEREVRSKEHDRPVSKQPSSLRSRSRSGSRTRKRSISPSKLRSSRNRKRSRSRSKEPIKPPEPPLSGDEDNDEDEEPPEDEEMEDQDLFNAGSERSGLRRYKGPASDGEDREVEKDYEDISSEDEMAAIEDPTMMQVLDLYELEEEPWGGFHTLNPVEFYVTPLMELKSPALSKFEIQMLRYASHDDGAIERPQEAIELLNIIYTFTQEEHTDKWVVAIEELPDLLEKGLSYLMIHENKNGFFDTLVSWAIKGCDSDIAMSQPDAAFKVRHLKAGIRLAGCLSVLNEQIALTLLQRGIQLKLVSLIESEYIVFSIKHLALRSLSKTTHFAVGTQWFLGVHPDYTKGDNEETGYQRLVRNLLLEKIVKLTMSMTALLRKIHFYETLTNLYNTVERIVSTCPIPDDSSNEEDEQPQLKDEEANKILADLEEATQIFTDPHFYIGQQHNAVPYTLLVDTNTKSSESLETIYNVADSCGLLESLFALLSCPASAANPSVYLSVHTILQRFMSTQDGLVYLCSHPDVINGIIRCLLQMVEEPEESGDDIPSRQLGLELVYHLQVIQYIDQLYHCQNKVNKLVDDPEVIVILHGLYTMTYSAANRDPLLGRNILSKVFSFDKNIEVLLPYLERTGDEDFDMLMKRSVCANCSIQLLLIVIKTSSDVNLLSNYAHRLLALCENGGSTKLSQLQEWLAPAKKVTSFDLDGLPSIISQLKQYTDDVKKVPPGLITIVRMIYFLISSAAADASVDNL
ncbi:protein virilizer, partial [Biomphalaria pfeifferi]